MNAIPPKPFEAAPVAGKPRPDSEAENVRLTIDFEDEPEDGISPAAGAPQQEQDVIAAQRGAMATATMKGETPGEAEFTDSGRATAAQPPGDAANEPPQASAARRRAPGQAGDGSSAPGLAVPPQLAGIEVTLSVEIGSHRLPLRDLLSIDPGQLFALDQMTSDPVSILVNGKPFAQGEIVAIGDRFGVRLLDIIEREES